MTSNREEKNKVPGFPVGSGSRSGQREEQHAVGFPPAGSDSVDVDALVWLVRPVREYRRWARRRHQEQACSPPARHERINRP
jgi:hypothetical protein